MPDIEALQAEEIAQGYRDEVCPTCGTEFKAYIHFIRCEARPCPMISTKETPSTSSRNLPRKRRPRTQEIPPPMSVPSISDCERMAVARERERCAKIAESVYGGRSHNSASENADVYRAQDAACAKIAAAIRAQKE